ncbi:MAG: hypothetical protein IVW56_08855 [Candidatus Binataceae bacterium]|nr:hypothetical protein [Candidatus Binataceae bacterium]
MKKGVIALLALLLAMQVGIGCGVAQAAASLEVPCCGANCPFPSATGNAACCQAQNSERSAQAVSAKASLPSMQSLTASIHPFVALVATHEPDRIAQASGFPNSPSGVTKLALLCSRQI